MKNLDFYSTSNIENLEWPEEIKYYSLETPALVFFNDFNVIKPLVIESSVSAIDVKNIMRKAHVKFKFVIDERKEFLGVVSADDLDDQRVLWNVSEGFKREGISIIDFMRPKRNLLALDFKDLATASIGDIIQALIDSGQRHCLVVDRDTNSVRGFFSASEISRMLQEWVGIEQGAEIFKMLAAQ